MTLTDYIARHADGQPDCLALVSGGSEWTYAQLYAAIVQRAAELSAAGICRGETCELPEATQDHRFVISYLAMIYLGALPLLYTTGTTGKPRPIRFTPEAWKADAENLIEAQGFQRELLFITTGPLNHFGNLSKLYPTFTVGAALYVIPGMKSLEDFFAALDYRPANPTAAHYKRACFLVPASIRMLLQLSSDRLRQYRQVIDFIETGAAPISQADMRSLVEHLPDSRLYNTYASTETGIVCTYQFNDGHQYASCVGPHLRHSEVFITDEACLRYDADAQHPGYITCQGATVMGGYYRTNDLGYLSPDGMLFLTGRASDIINVGGLKVSPVEIEDAVLTLPGIQECICLPMPHRIMGQVPRLLVVMAEGHHFDPRAIGLYLKSRLDNYKVPLKYEQVDHIERTYNGKPDRKAYQ